MTITIAAFGSVIQVTGGGVTPALEDSQFIGVGQYVDMIRTGVAPAVKPRLLLYENLPLRTSRMLGDFAQDFVLPHRYGDLTTARFDLGKLTASKWFVADHPMEVSAVFVDGQETDGWQRSIEWDGEGNSWTVVYLAAPADHDATVSACGTGKRSPTTGAVIENPAEVMADLCAFAGRSDTFPALRAECAVAGLRVAGSIDAEGSIRKHLDAICGSIGAIWTPAMARLYPIDSPSGPVATLTKQDAGNLGVSAVLEDTADKIRLAYDVATATDRPQHHLELSAAPARFGGVVQNLTMDWLRTPANAEAVGRRLMHRLAGERYAVTFDTSAVSTRPGDWVLLEDNPEWPFDGPDPVCMVLSVEVQPNAAAVRVTAETVMASPTVTVTAHTVAIPDTFEGALEVATRNGIATFTIYDEMNAPLPGARVSFDGGVPKTTNAQGQVAFPYTPGSHEIAIEAPGRVSQTILVTL